MQQIWVNITHFEQAYSHNMTQVYSHVTLLSRNLHIYSYTFKSKSRVFFFYSLPSQNFEVVIGITTWHSQRGHLFISSDRLWSWTGQALCIVTLHGLVDDWFQVTRPLVLSTSWANERCSLSSNIFRRLLIYGLITVYTYYFSSRKWKVRKNYLLFST